MHSQIRAVTLITGLLVACASGCVAPETGFVPVEGGAQLASNSASQDVQNPTQVPSAQDPSKDPGNKVPDPVVVLDPTAPPVVVSMPPEASPPAENPPIIVDHPELPEVICDDDDTDTDTDNHVVGNCGSGKVLICHVPPGNPNARHSICISPQGAIHGHGLDLNQPLMIGGHGGDTVGSCTDGGPSVEM